MMDKSKLIDFSKIKFGTLTRAQKKYEKEHPSVNTVKKFAHLIERKPKEFSKKMEHKARFYVNILEKK